MPTTPKAPSGDVDTGRYDSSLADARNEIARQMDDNARRIARPEYNPYPLSRPEAGRDLDAYAQREVTRARDEQDRTANDARRERERSREDLGVARPVKSPFERSNRR